MWIACNGEYSVKVNLRYQYVHIDLHNTCTHVWTEADDQGCQEQIEREADRSEEQSKA